SILLSYQNPPHPISSLFPYTTLFRSRKHRRGVQDDEVRYVSRRPDEFLRPRPYEQRGRIVGDRSRTDHPKGLDAGVHHDLGDPEDRKSTRLNSSHEWISYAVFCLKKK